LGPNYLRHLNAAARARWEARYRQVLEEGRTWPDAYDGIARLYLERRLREQRLEARQWLAGRPARKPLTEAEQRAQERWYRQRRGYAPPRTRLL
jgi:hypothetical protein